MTQTRINDDASGLLTHEAFRLMVEHLLKHAARTQEFLTLLVFVAQRASREVATSDEKLLRGLARLIQRTVRQSDVLGRTADGMLSLLLAGVDVESAKPVIARLMEHLERYDMAPSLRISIGAASCPTHAVEVDELLHYAISRAGTPLSGTGPTLSEAQGL